MFAHRPQQLADPPTPSARRCLRLGGQLLCSSNAHGRMNSSCECAAGIGGDGGEPGRGVALDWDIADGAEVAANGHRGILSNLAPVAAIDDETSGRDPPPNIPSPICSQKPSGVLTPSASRPSYSATGASPDASPEKISPLRCTRPAVCSTQRRERWTTRRPQPMWPRRCSAVWTSARILETVSCYWIADCLEGRYSGCRGDAGGHRAQVRWGRIARAASGRSSGARPDLTARQAGCGQISGCEAGGPAPRPPTRRRCPRPRPRHRRSGTQHQSCAANYRKPTIVRRGHSAAVSHRRAPGGIRSTSSAGLIAILRVISESRGSHSPTDSSSTDFL